MRGVMKSSPLVCLRSSKHRPPPHTCEYVRAHTHAHHWFASRWELTGIGTGAGGAVRGLNETAPRGPRCQNLSKGWASWRVEM